ncbi:YhhN-like protein [Dictyocaulus viviparus]|uniref:lysoplasmalogenase n=1 Tax=Dictyocaulus viviparus TaxID=29172 RepID=A0A0D8XIF6_DICVI|nr:YhhN-like protein [Dictyocaulus viviparus]
MRSVLFAVGAVYFILIANFYNESLGFTNFYSTTYALWKVVPIMFLMLFALFDGGGIPSEKRLMCSLGIFFGGVGDVLIGLRHDGIVPGAIAFAIGHLFYMTQFFSRTTKLNRRLLFITFLWGMIVGLFCMLPMSYKHPFAVVIIALYSLLLSACFAITGSQYLNRQKEDDEEGLLLRYLGYLLFYISDSVLIMTHTGYKIPYSCLLILGTYYSAQYLILCGNIHTAHHLKIKCQ